MLNVPVVAHALYAAELPTTRIHTCTTLEPASSALGVHTQESEALYPVDVHVCVFLS